MGDAGSIDRIRAIYQAVAPLMDERARRHWAAAEARAHGWGGIRAVSGATGLSPNTIRRGLAELRTVPTPSRRIRRHGGGRRRQTEADPGLRPALERLLSQDGSDRSSHFRWSCESTATLAAKLALQGHPVSRRTVGRLLRDAGYRLDRNRPMPRRRGGVGRRDQFLHVARAVDQFIERGQPVVVVTFRSEPTTAGGGHPPDRDPDRAASRDKLAARNAVGAVARWWAEAGLRCVPRAADLLLVVDGCGYDPGRRRTWKAAVSALPARLGLPVQVCHLPPGITRWSATEDWTHSKASRAGSRHPAARHEVVIGLVVAKRPDPIAGRVLDDPAPDGISGGYETEPDHSSRPPFAGDWDYRLLPSQN